MSASSKRLKVDGSALSVPDGKISPELEKKRGDGSGGGGPSSSIQLLVARPLSSAQPAHAGPAAPAPSDQIQIGDNKKERDYRDWCASYGATGRNLGDKFRVSCLPAENPTHVEGVDIRAAAREAKGWRRNSEFDLSNVNIQRASASLPCITTDYDPTADSPTLGQVLSFFFGGLLTVLSRPLCPFFWRILDHGVGLRR